MSSYLAILSQFQDMLELHKAWETLSNTFFLEMKEKRFYAIESNRFSYFESSELFGRDVFDRFPSANDDIFEAGCCLALERPTACVMHLMRVLESGLRALALSIDISPQNDWGGYLRAIDAKVRTFKTRSENEQFLAEASASLDRIRRAWRNPTMHVGKNYTIDRAEEILMSVKSFMIHLSTQLGEVEA